MIVKPQATTDNFDLSWIQKDVLCWIYHPQQEQGPIYTKGIIKGIVPLTFNKGNSKVMCVLENGLQHQTKASNLQKRRHTNSVQRDLISLDIINPAEILFQLRKRLDEKKIHTYMWNSLIIVNPFVKIEGMYDQKIMKHFYDRVITQKKQLPDLQPHIYGFVCNILNNMKQSQKAQMISISGESGSGKTETNKQCLKIISYVCESHIKTTDLLPSYLIEERILNCDSVLECFGNAKTSKNDNSSRFGKLITQKINSRQMEILNCEIKVFFLEKSRIVHQIHGERNFHIFYQLLNNCPQGMKTNLGFKTKGGIEMRVSDFSYLSKEHPSAFRDQDKQMWNSLNSSFKLLDISESHKKHIFQIIAAVLHLGNLRFDETNLNDHDPCQIVNDELVVILANLLMIQPKKLKDGLVFNKKQIAGDVMHLPMTQKQCVQGRDSMAKALYQNLFFWIVEQLNKKVNESQRPQKHVKIVKMLDIYGFQVFDHNSFEQLCVNYTNQRIHQIYLDQVFKNQKNILKKQGLQSIIPQLKFTDNTKVIELLDTSLKSVFNLLDESCALNVKDDDFLSNVKKMSEGHENFPATNNVTLKKCFIIKHTPGDIQYMAVGFRNKNKDFLREDIIEKFSSSKSPILSQKFIHLRQMLKSQNTKKFLGFKIRKEVTALMNEMSFNSDMHFIRCIKPNQQKLALTFVDRVCYNQVRYLGVLDTVRMRKDCYHVRVLYADFWKKFGILNGNVHSMIKAQSGGLNQKQCKQMVKGLMQNQFKTAGLDYLFGNQRIFMKMETNNYIQAVLAQKTKKIAHSSTLIKVLFRNRHKRNERLNFTVHIRKVQIAMKSYLRDIIQIKRRNAVKVIEKAWIERSEQFFRRKKLKYLRSLQKYIKRIVAKKDYHQKYESISVAKNMLKSMCKVHDTADNFEKIMEMKGQFNDKISNILWTRMSQHYCSQIKTRLQAFSTVLQNRALLSVAQAKTSSRLLMRNISILQSYLPAIPYFKKSQFLHNNVVLIQKFLRMGRVKLKYEKMHKMATKIQKAFRNFMGIKHDSIKQINLHFQGAALLQNQWKNMLHRNLDTNQFVKTNQGIQRILQKFEKIKKDKIVLFYYLLDVQVLSDNASLNKWLQNYLYLTQDSLLKMNPIQYIDVSNTHTAAATTNKVYTWGLLPQLQQHTPYQGKLSKITCLNKESIIETINPATLQSVGSGKIQDDDNVSAGNNMQADQQANTDKQWNTLTQSFVLLNGIVLTMHNLSFTKLNLPQKINQIACGMGHVICKTILKKVYTWGHNHCGQLGTGDYFGTSVPHRNGSIKQPRLVQYFYKRRIPVNQVAASPDGSIVLDLNNKMYWFGSNGTISNICQPEQCFLHSKSVYLGNHSKYSPVKLICRWSRTVSLIGVTIACHDDILKNQISLRKKVLQNLMTKWSQDFSLINPPYSQSVADNISERHMPLPNLSGSALNNGGSSNTARKNLSNKEIRDKIISDIGKIQQAERQLLKIRKNEQLKNQVRKKRQF